MAKKNIVVLTSDGALQGEIAENIAADFAARYPEYEIIEIAEREYRAVPAFFKRGVKRFCLRFFPASYRFLRSLRAAASARKLKKRKRVFAHFPDPYRIREGAHTGLRAIKNIVYRFQPKCIAALDTDAVRRAVAAKRKYGLNVKIVSVVCRSYFDAYELYYGVDRYAVESENQRDYILSAGLAETGAERVSLFRFPPAAASKGACKEALGLENAATFLVVPPAPKRRAFARMIADIYAADPEFNTLVYTGASRRLKRYFERLKVKRDLFRMRIAEDFASAVQASDYVLSAGDMRAVNYSFAAGALPIVYCARTMEESKNAGFYAGKNLIAGFSSVKQFPDFLSRIMRDFRYDAELRSSAGEYLASLPKATPADVIAEAARRLDTEQQI